MKQSLDEILEKLPEEFNMADITGKVEERTPYVVVAFQECERMNLLNRTIRSSLKELDLGFKVNNLYISHIILALQQNYVVPFQPSLTKCFKSHSV